MGTHKQTIFELLHAPISHWAVVGVMVDFCDTYWAVADFRVHRVSRTAKLNCVRIHELLTE